MNDADLIRRWSCTGLLRGVTIENAVIISRRLQIAADKATTIGDSMCVDDEISKLRGEGLFGKDE